MYNHEPTSYICPICNLVNGNESEYNKKSDIVYQDENTIALINPKWWINNPGHVIVTTLKHYENIYDIPDHLLGFVNITAKKIALAMKATYHCAGVSTRQHNEPAADQSLWHYHMHVFPRYPDDNLYLNTNQKRYVTAEERIPYATKLRNYFVSQGK